MFEDRVLSGVFEHKREAVKEIVQNCITRGFLICTVVRFADYDSELTSEIMNSFRLLDGELAPRKAFTYIG
jgi:hypothetical protein